MTLLRVAALERKQRRAAHHRDVVPRKLVGRQQLAHLQFDQIQQLRVVHHVDLVHEYNQRRHPDLARQQDVLAGLRHRAVRRRHHQDRAVHLRRPGDHVLDVVGMTRAVDMRIVALVGLVLDMRRRDRDAARAFFGRLVDLVERHKRRPALLGQDLGDRRRQRRLAVVDVTDRPDIAVRLRPLKLRLRHCLLLRSIQPGWIFQASFVKPSWRGLRPPPPAVPARNGRNASCTGRAPDSSIARY